MHLEGPITPTISPTLFLHLASVLPHPEVLTGRNDAEGTKGASQPYAAFSEMNSTRTLHRARARLSPMMSQPHKPEHFSTQRPHNHKAFNITYLWARSCITNQVIVGMRDPESWNGPARHFFRMTSTLVTEKSCLLENFPRNISHPHPHKVKGLEHHTRVSLSLPVTHMQSVAGTGT